MVADIAVACRFAPRQGLPSSNFESENNFVARLSREGSVAKHLIQE